MGQNLDSELRELQLFRGLAADALTELASRAVVRDYAAGERLWNAGDATRGLMVVLSGRIRVIGMRRERQYLIHTESPGGSLGEVPLFAGGSYPATAIAATPVRCLAIDAATLRRAMAVDVELSWRIAARLARRVETLLDRLQGLATGTVRNRLCSYLAAEAALAPDGVARLGGSQAQLAEELGTVREVVARELAWLREERIIASAGHGQFAVVDPDRLDDQVERGRSPS